MAETIFSSPIFMDVVLPFLLVFTLVFAILDKSKLLGEGKRQINAITSFVIAVILIAFPFARDIIVKLVPFLVVCIVILFVFMLIYGFISGKKEGDVLPLGLKITLGIIFGLAVIVAVMFVTGTWDDIYDFVSKYYETFWINVIFLAVIGGAIAIVLSAGGKSEKT